MRLSVLKSPLCEFDPLGCKMCFYSWSPSSRFVTCFIFIFVNKVRVDQSCHLLHPHILPSSISLHLCLLWDCLVTVATASSRHERKGERKRRKMVPASCQCFFMLHIQSAPDCINKPTSFILFQLFRLKQANKRTSSVENGAAGVRNVALSYQ